MARFDPTKVKITEEEAQRHLDEILDAESAMREDYFDKWDTYTSAYEQGVTDGDEALGTISATIQGLLPYIFHTDPSIHASARRQSGDEARQAKVAAAALTYEWEEAGDYDEVEQFVLDSLIAGIGIGRVAYNKVGLMVPAVNYDTTTDVDDVEEEDPEEAAKVAMLRDRLEEMGLRPDLAVDHAVIERVSPYNFITPTGYTDIRRMPWVAVRHLVHIDDVKNNPEFSNTKDIKADQHMMSDAEGSTQSYARRFQKKVAAKHVEVYEEWFYEYARRRVREGGKSRYRMVKELHVLWLANQGGSGNDPAPRVLKHQISHLDMEGYPFEALRWWRVPRKFVGVSMVGQLMPLARWVQRLVEGAVSGLEAAMALKVLYKEANLGKNGAFLLQHNRPAAVPVKTKRSVQEAIAPLILPAFPQEFHGVINMLRSFMAEVGGGDEAMRGGRSSAKSATESAIRATSSRSRSDRMLALFERMLKKLLKKKFQIMQQYFDADRWVQITGEDVPVRWSRADIQGEFAIGIHVGSTVPSGPEADRQGFIGFLQALATAAQAAQSAQVPPQAVAELYKKSLELWDQDSPELRDGFAALLQGVTSQAGAGPAPAPDSVSEGAASNPMTGETLNSPAAGRLASMGAEAAMAPG